MVIYLIGSLRSPRVPEVAAKLRESGVGEVFDNWFSAGEIADDAWRDYERGRGHDYSTALKNHSARHVYAFDRFHINRAHAGVLMLPAGRSGHLEAGVLAGQGKPVFMLLDQEGEPERLDVMTQFLESVHPTVEHLVDALQRYPWPKFPDIGSPSVEDVLQLAGLLEGEGSFCLTGTVPRLVLQMTDRDVVANAARLFNSAVWVHQPKDHRKTVWACGTAGLKAIEWMRILRPYLGERRRAQIQTTVLGWLEHRKYRRQDYGWWSRMFGLYASAALPRL